MQMMMVIEIKMRVISYRINKGVIEENMYYFYFNVKLIFFRILII